METQNVPPEELRELIQGPSDVEWTCVPGAAVSHPHQQSHNTPRLSVGTKCAANARRSCHVSTSDLCKRRSRWTRYSRWELRMCTSRPPSPHFRGGADTTAPLALFTTRSVCIRDAKEAFSVRPRFADRFQYMVLDVQDNEEQNLIRLFPQ